MNNKIVKHYARKIWADAISGNGGKVKLRMWLHPYWNLAYYLSARSYLNSEVRKIERSINNDDAFFEILDKYNFEYHDNMIHIYRFEDKHETDFSDEVLIQRYTQSFFQTIYPILEECGLQDSVTLSPKLVTRVINETKVSNKLQIPYGESRELIIRLVPSFRATEDELFKTFRIAALVHFLMAFLIGFSIWWL